MTTDDTQHMDLHITWSALTLSGSITTKRAPARAVLALALAALAILASLGLVGLAALAG